ncbi:MAG: 4Fe-4S dicluster domain-containing protein [Candidatus Hodarchaeota archaeon]
MSEYETKILERVHSQIRVCYQCSICAGGCPVFRNNPEMNPRLVIAKLQLNSSEKAFDESSVWNCCLCLTCSERCPQGVDFAHVLIDLKNLSARKGKLPFGIFEEMLVLSQIGMTQRITNMGLKRRKKMNLPEVFQPNINEIQKIMELTGYNQLLNLCIESQKNKKYKR